MSDVAALPTYRPDCMRCGCAMDRHMDEGCWDCNCFGYNHPHENVEVFCGPKAEWLLDLRESYVVPENSIGGPVAIEANEEKRRV